MSPGNMMSSWIFSLSSWGETFSGNVWAETYNPVGSSGGSTDLTGTSLYYLSQMNHYIYEIFRHQQLLVGNSRYLNDGLGFPRYAEGGISTGPASGYPVTLHGTEAVIPLKNMSVPVQLLNGGSTQAGASGEEIKLLKEMVELQKEQIDTLKAKDTAPTVNVNVDAQGIIKEAGEYVSEKSRRGTLDVRTH
jgi:hypothetical protein